MSRNSVRITYWVTPAGDGQWRVKREGAARATAVYEDKADAVQRAKELARSQPLGQIIVQRHMVRFRPSTRITRIRSASPGSGFGARMLNPRRRRKRVCRPPASGKSAGVPVGCVDGREGVGDVDLQRADDAP